MKLVRVTVGLFEVNCVLFQLNGSRTLYIVDPGGDWKLIRSESRKFEYDEAMILFTHAHVDHISGAGELAEDMKITKVYLNPADLPLYNSPENAIPPYYPAAKNLPATMWPPEDPGIGVFACPGHSPGGTSYYLAEDDVLLSGDTLFRNSIGRTDLPGGDSTLLIRSVRKLLNALPDQTRVIPGHGPETDIAEEKRNNPYVM